MKQLTRSFAISSTVALAWLGASMPCAAQDIEAKLDESFTKVVQNAHLHTVLEQIVDDYVINIITDNRVIRPHEPERVDPQTAYVTDGYVERFEVSGTTLREGLKQLLSPLGLEYSIQPSFIWISTPKTIARETFEDLETRYYTLGGRYIPDVNAELRQSETERIDFVALVDQTVPSILEPISGQPLSFVRYDEATRSLIAHTTPSRHKRIESLLAATGQTPER